jgi:hypothetical protein
MVGEIRCDREKSGGGTSPQEDERCQLLRGTTKVSTSTVSIKHSPAAFRKGLPGMGGDVQGRGSDGSVCGRLFWPELMPDLRELHVFVIRNVVETSIDGFHLGRRKL